MIEHHLNNPFGNPTISEEKFDKVTDTHIQRTTANNGSGVYTTLLNETIPLYNNWKQKISVEAIETAVRQGKTISVNDAVKVIKDYISRKRGVIKDKFAEGTTQYEEFYPNGALEYSNANLGNIRVLTERWIAAATAHAADLPANLGSDCQLFLDAFNTARTAQLQSAGEVIENDSDSDIARNALAKQLKKNLHSLVITHIDDVERVKDFFDLAITKKKKSSFTGKVNGNSVKNVLGNLTAPQRFEIENTGPVPLWFYSADTETAPQQGWGVNLQPGQKQTVDITQLGGLREFLNVHNQSATQGSFKVKVLKPSPSDPTHP